MNDMAAGWEMQQANEERERATIEALNRCVAAGAKPDDIKHLARECGVDPKQITIGEQRAQN
jgi:hypothetical protein